MSWYKLAQLDMASRSADIVRQYLTQSITNAKNMATQKNTDYRYFQSMPGAFLTGIYQALTARTDAVDIKQNPQILQQAEESINQVVQIAGQSIKSKNEGGFFHFLLNGGKTESKDTYKSYLSLDYNTLNPKVIAGAIINANKILTQYQRRANLKIGRGQFIITREDNIVIHAVDQETANFVAQTVASYLTQNGVKLGKNEIRTGKDTKTDGNKSSFNLVVDSEAQKVAKALIQQTQDFDQLLRNINNTFSSNGYFAGIIRKYKK